jgi:hypothetical protein
MKSSLKWFDSYLMNFMTYGLLFGEKHAHFLKNPFHLENLEIWKYVLINELYNNKSLNGKKFLGINSLLLHNYKKHFKLLRKKQRKWTFKFVNSCNFLVHPTMQLLINNQCQPLTQNLIMIQNLFLSQNMQEMNQCHICILFHRKDPRMKLNNQLYRLVQESAPYWLKDFVSIVEDSSFDVVFKKFMASYQLCITT